MANAKYPKFLESLLGGTAWDLTDGSLKMALIDTADYTYNAAHDFWDDASAGLVGTAVALTGVTVTNGKFTADNPTFTSVAGDQFEAVIAYYDTGTPGTSPLVAYWDGISVTPDGGNVVVTIPADAFSL
jgi:hypothetical protein